MVADAPTAKGGGGAGFGAHELLEAALAVCLNMAVRMHAESNGLPLTGVNTRVSLHRPAPDTVCFEYSLELTGPLTDDHRGQLEEIARTCPVRQTLSKRIDFASSAARLAT
ncbi:MAG: OsmC family protein [Steroidobacteraceae bacterium]